MCEATATTRSTLVMFTLVPLCTCRQRALAAEGPGVRMCAANRDLKPLPALHTGSRLNFRIWTKEEDLAPFFTAQLVNGNRVFLEEGNC